MCLIAHRQVNSGTEISDNIIEYNCWLNDDGFGLAWRERNGIKSKRFGPSEQQQFVSKLKQLNRRNVELVAHFRMATHGPATRDLAHPFSYVDPVHGRIYVFHNGVIDILTDKSESDTQAFVRDVLAKMPSGWFDDPVLNWLVGNAIGWSRLLIMTPTATYKLGDGWKTVDGVHYSTEPTKVYYSSYTTQYDNKPYKSSSDAWRATGKGTHSMTNDEFRRYMEDKFDDYEEEALLLAADTKKEAPRPAVGQIYTQEGHRVEILDVEGVGARWGGVSCLNCGAEGMYWENNNGGVDTDLEHLQPINSIGGGNAVQKAIGMIDGAVNAITGGTKLA